MPFGLSWFNSKSQPKKRQVGSFAKSQPKSQPNPNKSRLFYHSSSRDSVSAANFKVFKPNPEKLVNRSIFPVKTRTKPLSFGLERIGFLRASVNILSFPSLFKNLNLYILKWKLIERFNKLVAGFLVFASIIFLIYLSFFDTRFLIKTYAINFPDGSFLSESESNKIVEEIRDKKMFGFLPGNQYWFINNQNLTLVGRGSIPEVLTVEIKEKSWPNQASLEIKTEPILLTLGVIENNEPRYWRISQSGNVLTEDTLNLRESLVMVDLPITFDKPGVTLKDYKLKDDEEQVNRFWFVFWLWQELNSLGIEYVKTSFPSIVDSDVWIQTKNGTKLLFNTSSLTRENQKNRLEQFFASTKKNDESQGRLAYVDFRIPKKIFICNRGKECDK